MNIHVNGEAQRLAGPMNLSELLVLLQLGDKRVAVELNGRIVPRSRHAQTVLAEGDELLIVQAIGGG
ncbi:sulfur carrier protein ThiS [Solimonas aquatica]|uniref:Sulfur carrier protein ThiS n=1 Tax=Solimonas aquatica TaxID=489703 RepID=A0A1H9GKN0_9GAMM|nr:sulfur carrier protein ThiS [Solimonas aquatica]SEQ50478.1 sulfur carrier protein ThiS [Solimonas aquatica]